MGAPFAELARLDRLATQIEVDPLEPIQSLEGIHLTVAGDGSGQNCIDRADVALQLCPNARAVIGSLILRGGRCRQTGQRMHSCKPWHHHAWLIEGERGHHDPSLQNLELWAELVDVELPGPVSTLRGCTVSSRQAQARILKAIDKADPLPADLIYLPGLVFTTDYEEQPPDPIYVHAWGRVADESVRSGGFTSDELQVACLRLPIYVAEALRMSTFDAA